MTTDLVTVGRCSIYEDRPQECRTYPRPDSYTPPQCTYSFRGEQRLGSCDCDIAACCSLPRDGGEPTGKYLPSSSGGKPCRYLVFLTVPGDNEKTAGAQGSGDDWEDAVYGEP